MSTVNQLEDAIYYADNHDLKFMDLSKKGGLKTMTKEERKTANKASQKFFDNLISIAKRLEVMNEVRDTDPNNECVDR